MVSAKSALRSLLVVPSALRVWHRLPGSQLSIFTFHRFAVPDLGVPGHDPAQLAQALEALRRRRIPLLSLASLVAASEQGAPLPRRGVIFTVDDGYSDFAEAGAPVFQSFDCPVTVFLVTGFLDGQCWLWWDSIRYLVSNSEANPAARRFWLDFAAPEPGRSASTDFAGELSRRCTALPDGELRRLISFWAGELGISLPAVPPADFRPMSWDAAAKLSREGVTFGPHSVTHPILPNTSAEQAEREIRDSWARLRAKIPDALSVFSYPNGDHSEREIELLRAAGLRAAVTTTPRYLQPSQLSQPGGSSRIPRFPYPDETQALLLTAAGFRLLQPGSRAHRLRPA